MADIKFLDTLKEVLLERGFPLSIVQEVLETTQTIDAVKVVRCKDCKYHKDTSIPEYKHCYLIGRTVKYNTFCSYGEQDT